MKHLFSIVAALLLLAAPAAAQTIKSLGFNSTNGNIVAATNTVWTNSFSFSSDTVAAAVRNNLGLGTNATVEFEELFAASTVKVGFSSNTVEINSLGIEFGRASISAFTRTNLGLRLPALTNTSNVTAMRALGGSTNTNEPYSGAVALTNTNVLTFSNGVLLKIE